MTTIPPGLDFSNLKVDCPPDPWQQLAAAAAAGAPAAGQLSSPTMKSRRGSLAGVAGQGMEEGGWVAGGGSFWGAVTRGFKGVLCVASCNGS